MSRSTEQPGHPTDGDTVKRHDMVNWLGDTVNWVATAAPWVFL